MMNFATKTESVLKDKTHNDSSNDSNNDSDSHDMQRTLGITLDFQADQIQ
jgi:hypothetical protein